MFCNKKYDRPTKLNFETILYNDNILYTKRLQSCIIKKNQKTYGLCSINNINTTLGFDVTPDFMYMPITTGNKFITHHIEKLDKVIEDEFNIVNNKYIKNSNFGK